MDSRTNTRSLKEKFYNQHIKEYFDFVQDTDLSPRNRRGLSKTLGKLNDQVKHWSKDKELFSVTYEQDEFNADKIKEKRPYLKINATETEMVVSVEEFFLIIDKSEDIKEKVDQILRYTEVESGNGSIPELEQTTEDTIIRSICDYFWKRYDKIDIERKDKKDVSKDIDPNYHYKDLKTYTYEDIIKIIGGIISTINSGIGVVNFLHICRKIRNIDVHNGRFFGLKEGYEINCFRLFTYMATVLLLRKSLEGKGKMSSFKFDKITMPVFYPKGSSCEIKLYSGDEVILPKKSKDGVVEYDVEWYRLYRLDISKYNVFKERIFTWNEFYPCAKFDGATIDIENAPNASSGIHNRSFHHVAESLKVVEDVLVDIDSKTGSIDNTVSNIDTKLDIFIKYGQNNSEIIRGLRGDLREGFQKLIESFHQFINKQNGPLDLDIILKLLVEQYESKQIEIERKRKRGLTLNCIVLALLMVLALFSFISSILCDHSILWLSHTPLILTIVSLSLVLFVLAIGGFYKLNNSKKTKKLSVSICLSILLALLIGGSYCSIPHKTSRDFVENYEFSEHNAIDNKQAVSYLEDVFNNSSSYELLRIKLATYYLKYGNDTLQALKLARPMTDVHTYPVGCQIAAETLMAHGDYTETSDLINEYQRLYGHSEPVFDRLMGIMCLFGNGREQDNDKALKLLDSSSQAGDDEASYYLGYFFSHDMQNYKDAKRKGLDSYSYNLPSAVIMYSTAAKRMPKAALELGKLYADLNVIDSASHYLSQAIDATTDNTDLHNEAIFQLGLLLEKQGHYQNEYLDYAKHAQYAPAILHAALTEHDHKTAIARYEKAGLYKGYRYIPPVAFEYLALGDSANALRVMKKTRPDGHFNEAFVSAMQRILGTPFVEKDSLLAMQLMQKSAKTGCLYAQMICFFHQIDNQRQKGLKLKIEQLEYLERIGEEIPFAYALYAWLCHWEKDLFEQLVTMSRWAMRKGHPAGALILAEHPMRYTNEWKNRIMPKNSSSFAAYYHWLGSSYQMALRMTPNKLHVKGVPPFNIPPLKQRCVAISWEILIKFYEELQKTDMKLSSPGMWSSDKDFWFDVILANHCFNEECMMLFMFNFSDEMRSHLAERALADAQPDSPVENLIMLSTMINRMSPSFISRLDDLYKGDTFRQEVLHSPQYNKFKDLTGPTTISLSLTREMSTCYINHISDEQLLLELSDRTDDDYDHSFMMRY